MASVTKFYGRENYYGFWCTDAWSCNLFELSGSTFREPGSSMAIALASVGCSCQRANMKRQPLLPQRSMTIHLRASLPFARLQVCTNKRALTTVCFEEPTPSAAGSVPLVCSAATLLPSCNIQITRQTITNREWLSWRLSFHWWRWRWRWGLSWRT